MRKKMTQEEFMARLDKLELKISKMLFNNLKIQQDSISAELDFYELDDDDLPSKGDKISVNGDKRASGENLMPDGSTINFKTGVVSGIIKSKDDEMYAFQRVVEKRKCSNGQSVQIFNEDPNMIFLIGNLITIDGKKMMTGKSTLGKIELYYRNGKITSIKSLVLEEARNLFKPRHL